MDSKDGKAQPGNRRGPLVVAWDTSTSRGVLAVVAGGDALAEEYFETVKGHTGWLMPLVAGTLKGLGADPVDIDALGVGIGPGNFTGLKVGVATAKAVAMALGLPLVGVPTLDTLAEGAAGDRETVLAVSDAKQGMFYGALYDLAGGTPRRMTEYMCVGAEDLVDRVLRAVKGTGRRALTVSGEPAGKFVGLLEARDVRAEEHGDGYPGARELLALVKRGMSEGAGDAVSVSPVYLKRPL